MFANLNRIFVVAILTGLSLQAAAFQLNDHEFITRQAVAEFLTCFPKYKDRIVADWLVRSNLDEDQNLIVKELFFSHYYSPHKKLSMWRGTSMDRMNNLAPDVQQCRAAAPQVSFDQLDQLGHALHHFQDMAVPVHVVPVKHSFWDGFENYDFSGDISSQWNCGQMMSLLDVDMQSILSDTAELTLGAVRGFQVEVVSETDHAVRTANGTSFWQESSRDDFGTYGALTFGATQFDDGTGSQSVSEGSFADFKQQQLRLAVQATLRGLVWALKPQ